MFIFRWWGCYRFCPAPAQSWARWQAGAKSSPAPMDTGDLYQEARAWWEKKKLLLSPTPEEMHKLLVLPKKVKKALDLPKIVILKAE